MDRDALDDRVQRPCDMGRKMQFHGLTAARHPVGEDVPHFRSAGREGVKLEQLCHVAVRPPIAADDIDHGLTGFVAGFCRLQHVPIVSGQRAIEPGEGFDDQLFEAREVIGHRAEGNLGGLGHPAVRCPCHAKLRNHVERGEDDLFASVRIVSAPRSWIVAHQILRAGLPL